MRRLRGKKVQSGGDPQRKTISLLSSLFLPEVCRLNTWNWEDESELAVFSSPVFSFVGQFLFPCSSFKGSFIFNG